MSDPKMSPFELDPGEIFVIYERFWDTDWELENERVVYRTRNEPEAVRVLDSLNRNVEKLKYERRTYLVVLEHNVFGEGEYGE